MHTPATRFLRIFLLLTAAPFAAGCATLSYYSQAITGQFDILARTRAIAELLDDSPAAGTEPDAATPPLAPAVKTRLATVLRVRDFATQALALPDNDSYRVYADLDRAQVAWNVVATPEFSLTPKEWCFPVAGCVPYRGYFSHKRAKRFADELRDDRLDVRVAGVAAYSTLGWFRDPVFSTQLRRSDADIAALIFHELAHQKLYLPGDATFNESFATTVEIEGMRRWLAQASDKSALDNYLRDRARHTEFVDLLMKYRARLEALYALPQPDDARDGVGRPRRELAVEEHMRAEKARYFEALRTEYADLRNQWGGYDARDGVGTTPGTGEVDRAGNTRSTTPGMVSVDRAGSERSRPRRELAVDGGYDSWFTRDLNNAHLASVGLYHQYVPAFQTLLASVHGDLPAFYQLARTISRLPAAERRARLAEANDAQTRLITTK